MIRQNAADSRNFRRGDGAAQAAAEDAPVTYMRLKNIVPPSSEQPPQQPPPAPPKN